MDQLANVRISLQPGRLLARCANTIFLDASADAEVNCKDEQSLLNSAVWLVQPRNKY